MRPSFLLLFLSVLTLGLSSCGFFGGGGEDPAAEAPSPEPVAAAPQTTPAEVFPEEEPKAEQPPTPPPPQSALEQSTNAEQRVQSVGNSTGKKDPFNPPGIIVTGGSGNAGGGPVGGLPVIAIETPPPPTPPNNAAGGGGSGSGVRGGSRTRVAVPAIPKITPLSIPELPQVEPPPNLGINPRFRPVVAQVPFNPGPPPPNTARAVEVSAVVQVGQVVKAIVKSPGEQSQYVGVGEYIGGGSVYVKDINIYAPAEPVVILEEYGQEVARAVGAAPLPPVTPPQPAGGSEETTVRGIKISELKLNGSTLLGKVKNDSDKPVEVKQLKFRFETKDGVLVGTTFVGGPDGVLTPGQQGFVRQSPVDTFGLPADQLTVKFEDWE